MASSDINAAAIAVEEFVRGFEARGTKPIATQVRPSGDDVDVIKVWVDLGPTAVDAHDWAHECEAAAMKLPVAAGFRIQVRAEKL